MRIKEFGNFVTRLGGFIEPDDCDQINKAVDESDLVIVDEHRRNMSISDNFDDLDALIETKIGDLIAVYFKQYEQLRSENVTDSGYVVTVINESSRGRYNHTTDGKRGHVVFVLINLNKDDIKVEFKESGEGVNLEYGDCVIFPSCWTHVYKLDMNKGGDLRVLGTLISV